MKTLKELETINTKNLLKYYQAERKRFYGAGFFCDCGCEGYVWEAVDNQEDVKKRHDDWIKYLDLIKSVLSKREHIEK